MDMTVTAVPSINIRPEVSMLSVLAIIKLRSLRCSVPYALEGLLRREIDAAGGALQNVQHGDQVAFDFSLAETSADALVSQLNEAGQGRIVWVAAE